MFFHEILNRNPLTALMFGFLTMTVLCLLIVAALALFGKSQISQVKAPQATIAETKASIGAITDAMEFGAQDAKNRTTPSDAVAVTTLGETGQAGQRRLGLTPREEDDASGQRAVRMKRLGTWTRPGLIPRLRPTAQFRRRPSVRYAVNPHKNRSPNSQAGPVCPAG